MLALGGTCKTEDSFPLTDTDTSARGRISGRNVPIAHFTTMATPPPSCTQPVETPSGLRGDDAILWRVATSCCCLGGGAHACNCQKMPRGCTRRRRRAVQHLRRMVRELIRSCVKTRGLCLPNQRSRGQDPAGDGYSPGQASGASGASSFWRAAFCLSTTLICAPPARDALPVTP
jgi:hypothetical protein